MGFWDGLKDVLESAADRGGEIVGGGAKTVAGVAGGAFGLVKDIALVSESAAPWGKGSDFTDVIAKRIPDRLGQVFEAALGPQSFTGEIIEGLPEGARAPGRSAMEGLETAYREAVGEPLSAIVTAGSLSTSRTYGARGFGGDPTALLRGSTWRDAYRIAQDRSPGQAIALAFWTDDVLDPREVADAEASDWYKVVSGTLDATVRLRLSPDVLAGQSFSAIRLGRRTVTAADLAGGARSVENLRSLQRLNARMAGKDAAQIRHEFFPNHAHGPALSVALADAGTNGERMLVLRSALGDLRAVDQLGRGRPDLANRIRRTMGDRDSLRVLQDFDFQIPGKRLDDEIARLNDEIDMLTDQQRLTDRAAAIQRNVRGTLDRVPAASRARGAVVRMTRSDFYQSSPYAAPLRVVNHYAFGMRPHHLVELEDPTSDVQVARMLRKSRLPQEQQDALRSDYLRALTPDERQTVLVRAEEEAVRSIAAEAGMTVDEIEKVLAEAGRNRGRAMTAVKSRRYDGEGRSVVNLRGDGPPVDVPLLVSQQANVLPLVDLDEVRRAAREIGRLRRAGIATTDVVNEALTSFYKLWKPSVLLRAAWPIRVVLDEQLRIMSKLGFLAPLDTMSDLLLNRLDDSLERARTGVKPEFVPGRRDFREVAGHRVNPTFAQRLPDDEATALGRPLSGPNIFKPLTGARASFDAFYGRYEEGFLSKLRARSTGQWRSLEPDDVGYREAWENSVNRQIGGDKVGRRVLEGQTDRQIIDWLRDTAEGREYAKRIPYRTRRPEKWLAAVREQVDSYLPSEELRQAALARRATVADLARWVPDAGSRPVVHGEVLAQTMGQSVVGRTLDKIIERAYSMLGEIPTNVLSRHPYADAIYRAEVERMVNLLDEQAKGQGIRLTDDVIRDVEAKARQKAVVESRRLLYDLAEESELGHLLRFVAPFYSAWQEVLTVWAGIAVDNPGYVARLKEIYGSPERAGLVTTDSEGKEYVTVKVPEWAKDIPWLGEGLASQGRVRFDKTTLNMVMQGLPGVGPVVQVPTYAIARGRPDVASTDVVAKFIFPYGIPSSAKELLLPATAKRLASLAGQEDDRAYRNAALRIYFTKVADFQSGKRSTQPTWVEAKEEADKFFNLRAFVSYFSPVALTFDTPYQPYIDAYRNLRETDPEHADERFLEAYGPEFFGFTQAMSKSVDGVPATLEAWQARDEYSDLIEEFPELGRLIVGAEGAGEFNKAVYETQIDSALRPGSGRKQRELPAPEDVIAGPNIRLGWIEYRRVMDVLTAELEARSLPNMQVKAAADLRAVKKAAIRRLSEQYPEWHAEFSKTDRAHWDNRIKGLRALAADPRLAQRADIQGLAEYLRLREVVRAELAGREQHGLTAGANRDVRAVWESAVESIKRNNLAAAELIDRYLANDPVEVE